MRSASAAGLEDCFSRWRGGCPEEKGSAKEVHEVADRTSLTKGRGRVDTLASVLRASAGDGQDKNRDERNTRKFNESTWAEGYEALTRRA